MMYKLTQNHISAKHNNQTTILDHQAGIYYGLNEVGTFIWEILHNSPADFDHMKNAVLNKFDVNEADCIEDLKEILMELKNAKLVEEI